MNRATTATAWVLLAVTFLLPLGSCKKTDEEPPQELQFTFEIVDHMTATGKTMTKAGPANASMTVAAAETDISGVVAGYISVQDLSSGKIVGSGNGSASFQTGNSTNYRVIRFHDGNGLKEVYDWLVAANIRLYAGRDSNFGRKDEAGCTGSEAVWSGAGGVFPQVNNVLQAPFKLGSVSTGGNQNWYGFWKSLGGDGGRDLSQRLIYVSPDHANRKAMF